MKWERKAQGRQRLFCVRSTMLQGLRILSPWCFSGFALLSLTAQAGENSHKVDEGFRRSTMVEQVRMTMMPPRLSPLVMGEWRQTHPDYPSKDALDAHTVVPYILRVDLTRQNRGVNPLSEPLFFMDNPLLLPPTQMDPSVTLERASELLIAHLSRFEGRTNHHAFTRIPTQTPLSRVMAQSLSRARPDGSTPPVSRANLLVSVTPASLEPEIINASSLHVPSFAHLESSSSQETAFPIPPSSAFTLRDKEAKKREMQCLAEAVYFEARSESEEGQAAVAQVVLNRVQSGLYPASICGVVYQNRHRYKACQFSFACEGRKLTISEPESWLVAKRIANAVLEGQTYLPTIGKATHYHANYVAPYWSRLLKRTDKIGQHIFYRLRPGQT